MSELGLPANPTVDAGPGARIRAARERQGMAIETLATVLKVPQAKLEALEAGRFEALTDITFVRALAQAVCRVLKVDPAPVLAGLPSGGMARLEKVSDGLNTPYRDRPGSVVPADFTPWRKPVWWAVGALIAAAGAFVLAPPRAVTRVSLARVAASSPVAAGVAPDPAASEPALSGVVQTMPMPVLVPNAAAAAAQDPALSAAQGAVVTAIQPSWVQATDGGGQVLMSRLMVAGESLELVGTPPIQLRIGNASGTQLRYRGKAVDLQPTTRDNIATLELR